MALNIVEFAELPQDSRNVHLQVANTASISASPAPTAVSGSSAQSAVFNGRTKYVRMYAEEDCRVAFGENPTATANSPFFLPANSIEYVAVRTGDRLAVIAAA